jgi:hypothetical protein
MFLFNEKEYVQRNRLYSAFHFKVFASQRARLARLGWCRR